jgi:hypothetical protein
MSSHYEGEVLLLNYDGNGTPRETCTLPSGLEDQRAPLFTLVAH